jgi:hypothetical protein
VDTGGGRGGNDNWEDGECTLKKMKKFEDSELGMEVWSEKREVAAVVVLN